MIVNMLQNLSQMNSNHFGIIKCVGFESIHMILIRILFHPLRILEDLILCFYKMNCYFESIKLLLLFFKAFGSVTN